MKSKWFLAATFAILLLAISVTLALAQEPPPPYAGVKNPFSWDDAGAQAAGKAIYQQSCGGCHGATGAGVAAFNFSTPNYAKQLEAKPDAVFYALSEGRLTKGMPPYKSSLSEEQRWQVITYIRNLGAPLAPTATPVPTATPAPTATLAPGQTPSPTPVPSPTPLPTPTPAPDTLKLEAPPQAETGQELTLVATLKDGQGKPKSGAVVKFLLQAHFFADSRVDIGEATTNAQGIASVKYTPRGSGDAEIIAWFNSIEAKSKITVADSGKVFYHTEVGMQLPAPGPEVFVGPASSHGINDQGDAPMTALRLPGGTLSWLWLFALALGSVWAIYMLIMYHVLRISQVKGAGASASLVPRFVILGLVGLTIMVMFMVLTGPYSHFHLG